MVSTDKASRTHARTLLGSFDPSQFLTSMQLLNPRLAIRGTFSPRHQARWLHLYAVQWQARGAHFVSKSLMRPFVLQLLQFSISLCVPGRSFYGHWTDGRFSTWLFLDWGQRSVVCFTWLGFYMYMTLVSIIYAVYVKVGERRIYSKELLFSWPLSLDNLYFRKK